MIESFPTEVDLVDQSPEIETYREEVLSGLGRRPKTLPCKHLYDAHGSRLFDQICELEEYYPTRTELRIMQKNVGEMVECLGPRCLLVEYGSGSSIKTRILLDHMLDPAAYVPIDISREHLADSAARLREAYPNLEIVPFCADYTATFDLPDPAVEYERAIVYFPGSTIGNFDPSEARRFLRRMASVAGPGGALLIGVDLRKDRSILEAAYDDARGVTAAFNKNLLTRINRELGGAFDLDAFEHEAIYNVEEGRVEMYLVSLIDQHVRVDGELVGFERGERICTEHSYKYTLTGFADLALAGGFRVKRVWTDPENYFSVQYCVVE